MSARSGERERFTMSDAGGGDAGTKRQQAAERSRAAILDAAEKLFAEKGYEGTSLREIGEAAGLSRGTPAYFFGSKEGLYRAVLDRVLRDAGALIEGANTNFLHPSEGERPKSPEEGLAATLGPYIDFLASRPSYMGIAEREALGRASGGPAGRETGAEDRFPPVISMLGGAGVDNLTEAMGRGAFRPADPRHLAASIIALCSYPFMLGGGLARTLGIEPDDPAFVEEWKRHVVDLLVHGVFAPEDAVPSGPLGRSEEGDREQGERERLEEETE